MGHHTRQRRPNYFSFLLRGWQGTNEQGEIVWRFALVATLDGSAQRFDDWHELIQFLRAQTQDAALPDDAKSSEFP